MTAAPAFRMHVHLPIIEQTVVMTVPAALRTQCAGIDPRLEVEAPVDQELDHWALWLLADGALGGHDRYAVAATSTHCEIDLRTHRPDHDWSHLCARIESHEGIRARYAWCAKWNLQRVQQAHGELGVMRDSDLRDVHAWFGGATPATARHVAPQPELISGLVDDLLEFANLRPNWPFLQAVLVHYQLVMIHAFRDGNGRLARLLAACVLERARRPLAPLYAGFALQRWGSAHRDDALEAMAQGNIEAYIVWWARARRYAGALVSAIHAEREQAASQLSVALGSKAQLSSAMTRAVMRSPSLVLSRFAEVHGINARRQQELATALRDLGWRRVDATRWLCVSALARAFAARNDLYARHCV